MKIYKIFLFNMFVFSFLSVFTSLGLCISTAKEIQNRGAQKEPNVSYPELLTIVPVTPSKHEADEIKKVVIRKRHANIKFDLLAELSEPRGGIIKLNLFDDVFLNAFLTKSVKRSDTSYTWFGHIIGTASGTVVLTVEKDVMIANIHAYGMGTYGIRYLPNGLHEILEIDETKYIQCGGGIVPESKDADTAISNATKGIQEIEADGIPAVDNGTVMDVLVVYTAEARDSEGGTTAMDALINYAVDNANMAYSESQILPRLRLVYKGEIDYVESHNGYTDIDRLSGTNDGYMDNVHSLRDTYKADMVCLVAKNLGGVAGLGYLMTSLSSNFASWAFSVVETYNMAISDVFAHELGHNMGCHHAVGDSGLSRGAGLYNYSHGWRWYGDDGVQYRSIMAYIPGYMSWRFSNPNVFFYGQPTGRVNLEDNTRTINNAAFTIANWRQSGNEESPPVAENSTVHVEHGVAQAIELQATDNGEPVQPGALSFVIKSLPRHGNLKNATGTEIVSVPYILADYRNQVIYIATDTFNCRDKFTFTADDGGSPPNGGESNPATVLIKPCFVVYSADMNNSPGWSYRGDWEWGTPIGGGTYYCFDPNSGYTGTNVVGYNLLGNYSNNMKSTKYVTTPAINCEGIEDVKLSFYRWLCVESTYYDHANIQVSSDKKNWIDIWNNNKVVFDGHWKYVEYDISGVADNQPTLYIRWGMGPTDDLRTYAGWNIDDVEVSGSVIPNPPVGDFYMDCHVDMLDFSTFAAAWLSCQGDTNWDSDCDIAEPKDNCIDFLDLSTFTQNWLTTVE